VNVRAISAATTVNTGSDADTVNVGSTTPATGGDVNSIAALLTVNGDGEADTLNVDDTGDSVGNTGTLTSTELTGLGMTGKLVYGSLEALKISLGSGDDTFTVKSTHGGSTELNTNAGGDTVTLESIAGTTTVNPAAEADTVNVRSISAATTINTGSDADTVNVGSLAPAAGGKLSGLAGALVLDGQGGADALNIDDSGNASAATGTLDAATLAGLGMKGDIAYAQMDEAEARTYKPKMLVMDEHNNVERVKQ
jgi:hypothetical protein